MKKKFLFHILIILSAFFTISCEEDSADVSTITNHVVITLNGDNLVVVELGKPYVDLGAVATEAGAVIDHEVDIQVNSNKLGLYYVTYSAVNSDGYPRSALRTVVVMPLGVPTDDLSGKYRRNAGKNGVSQWTKIVDGLYKVTDVGGAQLDADFVYAFNTEPNIIEVPLQAMGGSGSEVSCDDGGGGLKIPFTPGPVGTAQYSWKVNNEGYGPALRTFIRVE